MSTIIFVNGLAWQACVEQLGLSQDQYTPEVDDTQSSQILITDSAVLAQCKAWMDGNSLSYYLKDLD